MADINVSITYTAPAGEDTRIPNSIPNLFTPGGSYADSTPYEGTAYDTNVYGWEGLPGIPPMGTATNVFAWLERATKTPGEAVEFTAPDVAKIYWLQMADNLADQGFAIVVTDAEANSDAEGQ